jgi:hypothetical protein
MTYTTLQLAFDSNLATLTLNRPDKRNAISYELIDDLVRALRGQKFSRARPHPHRRRQGFFLRHGSR